MVLKVAGGNGPVPRVKLVVLKVAEGKAQVAAGGQILKVILAKERELNE